MSPIQNNIHRQCLHLRNVAIIKAKEDYDREGKDKIIKYNHFVELAHKAGRNQKEGKAEERDFQKSLNYLNDAVVFDPDRPEIAPGST